MGNLSTLTSLDYAGSTPAARWLPAGLHLSPWVVHYRRDVIETDLTARWSRLGVLASGTGTILAAMVEAGLPVRVVVVDRPCPAEKLAANAGIPIEMVERNSYRADFDRLAYTRRVVEALRRHGIGTVAMAGFGTVLSGPLFEEFCGRVLNTHPALLPSFKGWHAVRDALAYGVKVTGCTVHLATEAVDDGPILAQRAVPVEPGDTEASLHERIKAVERTLYPDTIRRFLEGVPR
jgi:phosphoribosylglycinamide formyltransferase-1